MTKWDLYKTSEVPARRETHAELVQRLKRGQPPAKPIVQLERR